MKWLCILASFLWGSNIVFMKSLLATQMPLTVAFWRVFFSAGVLWLLGKCQHISFHIDLKTGIHLVVLGLFNVTLNFIFSFMGMALISGANIALINALSPVLIALLEIIITHSWPNKKKVYALLLTLSGVAISFGLDFSKLHFGHVLLVLSLAFYSGSFYLAKGIDLHPMVKSFYVLFFGGLMLGVWAWLQGSLSFLNLSLGQWGLFFIISICGFAFIQWVYFTTCKTMGVDQTGFFMNLNPVFTYMESLLFLGETFDFWQLLGILLVVLGLVVSRPKKGSRIASLKH